MKNRILSLLLALSVLGSLNAQSSADQLIAFKKMEKGHKKDWLNYAKSNFDEKIDLMNKHHGEWVDFGIAEITKFKNTADVSAQNKEDLFKDKLKKAITLHKKQLNDWKEACDKQTQKGKEIRERHSQELNAFIEKNVPELAGQAELPLIKQRGGGFRNQ